jgi:hypothetical protein
VHVDSFLGRNFVYIFTLYEPLLRDRKGSY